MEVRVQDAGSMFEPPAPTALQSTSGRGFQIVAAISSGWGSNHPKTEKPSRRRSGSPTRRRELTRPNLKERSSRFLAAKHQLREVGLPVARAFAARPIPPAWPRQPWETWGFLGIVWDLGGVKSVLPGRQAGRPGVGLFVGNRLGVGLAQVPTTGEQQWPGERRPVITTGRLCVLVFLRFSGVRAGDWTPAVGMPSVRPLPLGACARRESTC
jgi:hypothetical protein